MLSALLASLGGVAAAASYPIPPPLQTVPANVPLQITNLFELPNVRCMDMPLVGASQQVQYAPCMPVGGSQAWRFKPQSDGSYLIVNAESGGCLDVEASSRAPNSRVLDWPCHGLANQRWYVNGMELGGSYWAVIWSVVSGHCLDVGPRGALQVDCKWTSNGNSVWQLIEDRHRQPTARLNTFSLSVVRGGLCAREVGAWIDLGACQPSSPKTNRMDIVPVSYDPIRFQLRLASGRCLGGTPSSGVVWASSVACNAGDETQVWEVNRSGDALQVRNRGNGRCLNAKDGASSVGTWLIHWPCSPGSDNARWRLTSELK
jgi:hypothetical protein